MKQSRKSDASDERHGCDVMGTREVFEAKKQALCNQAHQHCHSHHRQMQTSARILNADVGGFKIASELTWSLLIGAEYRFNRRMRPETMLSELLTRFPELRS